MQKGQKEEDIPSSSWDRAVCRRSSPGISPALTCPVDKGGCCRIWCWLVAASYTEKVAAPPRATAPLFVYRPPGVTKEGECKYYHQTFYQVLTTLHG